MTSEEPLRISQVGLAARSPEGHAAKGMAIKGHEDLWVEIQAHTFRNWVNENLRGAGMAVADLSQDFQDGTKLCALVEALQRRPLRGWVRRPGNRHQHLENVSCALKAVEADGVKLVNIGNVDIVNGNLKLILGLIWSLIVRYQIGRSKFPPKKLMLAWLRAALPECRIDNFTSDWNSGLALSALLDYCKPGLFPHWKGLNPSDRVENCRTAMELARREFSIPMVLEPEYLASPYLDELSGMTYLSYFMKENSPGFHATLRWVNNQIPQAPVRNFTRDWNDGRALCTLVKSLGGPVPGYKDMAFDPDSWESNLNAGIQGGKKLGVEPILRAKDMANKEVENLGVMAYAANFQWIRPRSKPGDRIVASANSHHTRVDQQTHFNIEFLEDDIDPRDVSVEVVGPGGSKVECRLNLGPQGGKGTFIPIRTGMHKVVIKLEGEAVKGSPIHYRVMPELTSIQHTGMEPCAVGSIVEVLINSNGTNTNEISVVARSPTGRELDCPVHENKGVHSATFQPDEAGEWTIGVMHGGQHIQGGPFTCFVFDPNGVKLENIDGAQPHAPFSFVLDTTATGGLGDVELDIVHERRSIPHHVEHLGASLYRVTLNTGRAGKYRVYVYFNGQDVRGSPFALRVGTQRSREKERIRANLEEREQLKSPQLVESATSPTFKLSSPSPDLDLYSSSNAYRTDAYETSADYSSKYKSDYDTGSKYRTSAGADYVDSGRYTSDYDNKYDSKYNSKYKSDYVTESRHVSSLETGLSRAHITDSLMNGRSSPYRHSPSPVPSPSHSPSPALYRSSSPRLSPSYHMNGVTEKRTESSRVTSLLNQRRGSWDKDVVLRSQQTAKTGVLEDEYSTSNLITREQHQQQHLQQHQQSGLSKRVVTAHHVEHAAAKRMASPLPSPHPDDLEAPVSGDALRLVSLHRPAHFTIDTSFDGRPAADLADVNIEILSPSRRVVPARLSRGTRRELVEVHFTASEVGEHVVDVHLRGEQLRGAPYRTHAYNARAIQVGRIPNGVLGQPVEFEIDGSGAGSGNLEILVNGGHVTSSVRTLGNQRFRASFVPHELLTHVVEMKFNGETVPGSPWQVAVMAGPKMSVLGEAVRLVAAGTTAAFELSALGFKRSDIDVHIMSPSKRPLNARLMEEGGGMFRIEFSPSEVGSHLVEVSLAGEKLAAGPLVAKVYNSSLIRVTEVGSGVVGQPCQFRVDASQAGEGQLEISINEGEVPNHVQVVGGGRCLVSFTPEQTKPHLIDIKFNGETVAGCPFVCAVSDTSRVSLTLRNLELVPVDEVARFHMAVDGSGSAELAVSVRGPTAELPVKVTGNVHSGFTAEFTPRDVGAHSITVEYNGHPVSGTPFVAKAYDAKRVLVGPLPQGAVGKALQFMVDASEAGEGNLEITISARGHNIPTQVHPQGNARFAVSFVPIEPTDHVISINFNKEPVPGSPFLARVAGDSPHHITVSGPSLSSAAVGKTSYFTMNNVGGSVEDIEVNVEGPNGQAVPAQVKDNGGQVFHVEFAPRVVGEHSVTVAYRGAPVAGSPFSCKVYDVRAIKVKDVAQGSVGKAITFLVETSQAGPGNLEVTVNGGRVPTSAQAQGPHTYAISFTPREATPHTVDLRFNGEDVPGSPFHCRVAQAARVVVSSEGLEKVAVNRPASFTVESEAQAHGQAPDVQVLSPSRRPLLVDVSPVPAQGSSQTPAQGRFAVHFTPTDVGDHSVEVKVSGAHVEGSPFLVKAYDAAKVKVTDINTGTVGKPVFFSINASQAGAGNLEIIVSVNGCNVPNYVQSEGNAKFKVNFKPQEAAPHSLSVRFNGEPVPGSPFTCKVLDWSQVLVSGPGLKACALGRPASITVDPQKAGTSASGAPPGGGTCAIGVVSPSGRNLPTSITQSPDQKLTATFTPEEVGRHSVTVALDGEPVRGSPFACNVYDVNKIKVTGLGQCKVGKPATFTVDACSAGEGTLELVVSTERSTVKAEVVACSRGLYDVTFVPHESTPHFVNISFNEEDVPGSPFRCDVLELGAKEGRAGGAAAAGQPQRRESRMVGVKESVRGAPAHFHVDPKGLDGHIDMEVLGPDGAAVPCTATRLPSGLIRVEYRPQQVGLHTVSVYHKQQPLTKQPLQVQVFDPQRVRVQELSDAFCHRAATFKVDTSGAGPGSLTVSVRAAGIDVKHSIRELHSGQYEVVFHPKLAIPHRIDVKYNGMHVAGCPMEVPVQNPAVGQDVMATGLGLYQARTGRVSSFVIETLGHPAKEFDVVISGPLSSAVPVRCYQQKDGNLLAEFTAASAGLYKIEVFHGARAVRGSPYHCQVFDASKVKVEAVGGAALSQAVSVNEKIAFKLQRKQAGFAELDVMVTSPLGQDLPLKVNAFPDDKDCDLIEFVPSLPGSYRFNITYGGEEIPGSPVTFTVEEAGVARAHGDGLVGGRVGSQASFKVSGAGLVGEPQVQIDGPEDVVDCRVERTSDGDFLVTYTPNEVGVHDVRVAWDGADVTGSPFHPRVVDPRKVRVIGGWEAHCDSRGRLELAAHVTKKINLDVAEAGPGQLTAECVGPSGQTVPVAVESAGPGGTRQRLLLTPRGPGEHRLTVLYGGAPLPRMPLVGVADAAGAGSGPVRVVLTGRGLAAAKCHQEAEFTIDGSQAGPGSPEVSITGMKTEVAVQLHPMGNSVYRATYTPTAAGSYLLNVMWSDRQVKGCPLKVQVAAVADATRVLCSGDGLRVGTVGKEIRSFIDTRRAGPGELTAHCVGPHKVAYCELYDHGDGTFTLNVKPQEAGRHALTVKYGGEHVPGSPYTLRVNGAPDASKVRVYGPGVEHGVLATFQSRFICDTRGAGAGQLTVRIRGPKGAFRVEMQRGSQKDRTILCKFDPTEPGDYRVEVKWAGEHVPGSPFAVMIFDTQEELNRFLQGNHSPGSHSELYGSVAYSTSYAMLNTGASWRGSQAQL